MSIFINLNNSANGTGSFENPYNTTTEVNALTGNLGGLTIMFKTGTRRRAIVTMASANNFVLGYYGTGERPIFDASAIVPGPWTLDQGTTYKATYATGDDMFFVNDIDSPDNGDLQLKRGADLTEVRATTNCALYSGGQVYVNLGGPNPTNYVITATNSQHGIKLSTPSNVKVSGLRVVKAAYNGLWLPTAGNNIALLDNHITYTGCWRANGQGNDGILADGVAAQTGWEILRNISNRNQNNSIELRQCTGMVLSANQGDMNGNGIELWKAVVAPIITRNKMINATATVLSGRGVGLWAAGSGNAGAGNNSDGTIEGNVFANNLNGQIEINSGAGWKVNQNTLVSMDSMTYNFGYATAKFFSDALIAADNVAVDFNNNIAMINAASRGYVIKNGATANNAITGDNNIYCLYDQANSLYRGAASTPLTLWSFNNTDYTTFPTYQAASTPLDVNSKKMTTPRTGDPGFTALGTTGNFEQYTYILKGQNYEPINALDTGGSANGAMVGTGKIYWTTGIPPTDNTGNLFHPIKPDIGAFQSKYISHPKRKNMVGV